MARNLFDTTVFICSKLTAVNLQCLQRKWILAFAVCIPMLSGIGCIRDNFLETSIRENISARQNSIIQNFSADRTHVSSAAGNSSATISFSLAEKGKYSIQLNSCQSADVLLGRTAAEATAASATITAGQVPAGKNLLKLCYWESVKDMLSDSIDFYLARDDAAPTIVSVTPADNAYHADTNTTVRVVFNKTIALPADTSTAIQVSNNQGNVTGTTTFDTQTNTLTFQPATNFGYTKNIQVQLLAGITDLAGNALTPVTIKFATRFTIQKGTLGSDMAYDLTIDSSDNMYLAGTAEGSLDGQPYQTGARDAFFSKYDSYGQLQFTRMIGSSSTSGTGDDNFQSILLDAAGNIFTTGDSFGSSTITFDGIAKIGSTDIVFMKYSSAGTKISTDLFGSTSADSGKVLLRDSAGNIFLIGTAKLAATLIDGQPFVGLDDVIVRKYDSAGTKIFTKIIGTTSSESVSSAVLDVAGNLYIAGGTLGGSFVGTNPDTNSDMYLLKYDNNGNMVWHRQVNNAGTERDAKLLIDNSGYIWECGYATQGYDGNATFGNSDIVLTKYQADGTKLFSRQYGTSYADYCLGIVKDSSGNIYISGTSTGDFGSTNADVTHSSSDIFLMKIDSNGNTIWLKQYGGSANDDVSIMRINSRNEIYIAGRTTSNLDGNTLMSASKFDFFLMKFDTSGNLY